MPNRAVEVMPESKVNLPDAPTEQQTALHMVDPAMASPDAQRGMGESVSPSATLSEVLPLTGPRALARPPAPSPSGVVVESTTLAAVPGNPLLRPHRRKTPAPNRASEVSPPSSLVPRDTAAHDAMPPPPKPHPEKRRAKRKQAATADTQVPVGTGLGSQIQGNNNATTMAAAL